MLKKFRNTSIALGLTQMRNPVLPGRCLPAGRGGGAPGLQRQGQAAGGGRGRREAQAQVSLTPSMQNR